MRSWAKVGLLVVLIVVGYGAVLAAIEAKKPAPRVSISCTAHVDSGDCKVENKGGATADVDVNVVVVCHDGEHTAHVSARVEPYSHVTKIIDAFEPSIGLLTRCPGIDYRDFLVR